MSVERIEALKAQLMSAARLDAPVVQGLRSRPIFIMAPLSYIGCLHGAATAAALPNVVAAIDDVSITPEIHGVARWTTAEFVRRAAEFPDALALDFSVQRYTHALVADICELAGVERVDCIAAIAELDRHAVYESVPVYRSKTLDRLDDFMRLAERFDDDYSRETLYANLLFRLSYERGHMMPSWANPGEEYFSAHAEPSTFRVGTREHFADCGAWHGPIVAKFLAASGRRYESITAIEPDRENFKVLEAGLSPIPLKNFRAINKAVSDRRQTLSFNETGTQSSHVSPSGTTRVQTIRLDDELEHLSLLKMDVEGFETRTLKGASRLIAADRPRIAACVYHYAQDLLDVVDAIDHAADGYRLRLRQHFSAYFYDLVLYASPMAGNAPAAHVA